MSFSTNLHMSSIIGSLTYIWPPHIESGYLKCRAVFLVQKVMLNITIKPST